MSFNEFKGDNKTPSEAVVYYINDSEKNSNEKSCLILGIIYACHDIKELEKIKTTIEESTLESSHKEGFDNTIRASISNLIR